MIRTLKKTYRKSHKRVWKSLLIFLCLPLIFGHVLASQNDKGQFFSEQETSYLSSPHSRDTFLEHSLKTSFLSTAEPRPAISIISDEITSSIYSVVTTPEREEWNVEIKELKGCIEKSAQLSQDKLTILKRQLLKSLKEEKFISFQEEIKQLLTFLDEPQKLILEENKPSFLIESSKYSNESVFEKREQLKESLLSHKIFASIQDRFIRLTIFLQRPDIPSRIKDILLAIKEVYQNYLESLFNQDINHLFPPYARLRSPLLSPSHVSLNIAYHLACHDHLDRTVKENDAGAHTVISHEGIHYKVYSPNNALFPIDPSMELCVYHLYHRLIGHGVAPTTFLILHGLPILSDDEPIIEDANLRSALKNQRLADVLSELDQLDTRSSPKTDECKILRSDDPKIQKYVLTRLINRAIYSGKTFDELIIEDPQLYKYVKRYQKEKTFVLQASRTVEGLGLHHFLQNVHFASWLKDNPQKDPLIYLKEHLSFKDRFMKSRQFNATKWDSFITNFNSDEWTINHLDYDNFAEMVIIAFVTDPSDAKADNFMVKKQGSKWHLVSIDSDRTFHQPIITLLDGSHQIRHKCCLYYIDELMRSPLSSTIKNKILNLNMPLQLLRWLITLRRENQNYVQMLEDGDVTKNLYEELSLPLQLPKGIVKDIYAHLEEIQSMLRKSDASITLDHLFKHLHPIIYKYYKKIQNLHPEDPFEVLYPQGAPSIEDTLTKELSEEDKENLSCYRPLAEEKERRTQTVDEALKELIDLINHQSKDNPKNNALELSFLDESDLLFRTIMNLYKAQKESSPRVYIVEPSLALKFYRKFIKNTSDQGLQILWQQLVIYNPKLNWYLALEHILPPASVSIPGSKKITGTGFGERILPPEIHDQLFNVDGTFKKQRGLEGTHHVRRIEVQGYGLYFKEYPKLPGLEEIVGRLIRQLIGFGAPHVELFRYGDRSILVSQEIKGLTLKETFQAYPERLKRLDPASISALLLVSMIINPEDWRAPNLVMEEFQPGRYRLVGIDNDQAFVPGVSKEQIGGSRSQPTVQVKNILFCLDQMLSPIHPEVQQKFRAFDPEQELNKWLRDADRLHKQQDLLFSEPSTLRQTLFKNFDSFIGIAFKPGDAREIYNRFSRLQAALNDPEVKTHLDLLMHVEPRVGLRYGKILLTQQMLSNIHERFKIVEGAGSETSSTSLQVLGAQGIPEKVILQDLIRCARQYSPELALKELMDQREAVTNQAANTALKEVGGNIRDLEKEQARIKLLGALDFNHVKQENGKFGPLSLNAQQMILSRLQGLTLYCLTLRNCIGLTDNILTNLQLDNLTKLTLPGCTLITQTCLPSLAQRAQALTSLDLSRCIGLTTFLINNLLIDDPLIFPELRFLILDNTNIKRIWIDAPKLEKLEAQRCTRLTDLQLVNSKSLTLVDLNEDTALSPSKFVTFEQTLPLSTRVYAFGCQQLHNLELSQRTLPNKKALLNCSEKDLLKTILISKSSSIIHFKDIKECSVEFLNNFIREHPNVRFDIEILNYYAQHIFLILDENCFNQWKVKSTSIDTFKNFFLNYTAQIHAAHPGDYYFGDWAAANFGSLFNVNLGLAYLDDYPSIQTPLTFSLILAGPINKKCNLEITEFVCNPTKAPVPNPFFDHQSSKHLGEIFLKYYKNLKEVVLESYGNVTVQGAATFRQFIPYMKNIKYFNLTVGSKKYNLVADTSFDHLIPSVFIEKNYLERLSNY